MTRTGIGNAVGFFTIGRFDLADIPPAPRGVPQIEVTFDIDANGILNVSAKDLGTGKEQKISITGSSGLSKEEVEKMQKEAEVHAEDDRKAKETIEIRNNADNLAYQCEKQLKELGDKVDGASKKNIEDSIEKVREALKGDDADAIKAAYDELQTKFQEVTAEAYKQAAASAGPTTEANPTPEPPPKKDDVVDAEFEVVDDDKKK